MLKTMLSIFFRANGQVHWSHMDKGKTLVHQSYINGRLVRTVNNIIKEKRYMGVKC